MKRRTILTTGTTIGLLFLAGCSSNGPAEEPGDTGPETNSTTTEGRTESIPGGDGGLSVEIEPSASEITWGEEYSVTVTIIGGSEYETDWAHTEIYWRTENGNVGIPGTGYSMWNLPTGKPDSHTFEISPPTTGEINLFMEDVMEGDILAEWTLTVDPPVAAFGEAVPYYDGLEVTMDARLTETIEAHIYDDYQGDDLGVYSIRPAQDKQWALPMIQLQNTSNSEMYPLKPENIAVVADGNQLNRASDLLFADQNEFQAVGGNPEGAYIVQLDSESGYYDPPSEIMPTASMEGWLPYIVEIDATMDDISVLLTRETASFGMVTARWE